MPVSPFPSSNLTRLPMTARLAACAVIGLALGVLTAYAQGWLPSSLGSLANSSGAWALVAFGLAVVLANGVANAALIGSLALLALLAGYVFGSNARGYTAGTPLVLFWAAAALLAGPLLGIAGDWVRNGDGFRPAVGVGAMSGVLIGEGTYGLTFIADTTFTPYWWLELILGAILIAWVVSKRPQRLQAASIAAAVAAVTAAAFVAVYSQDLIAVLP